jgi:hypothetical protein
MGHETLRITAGHYVDMVGVTGSIPVAPTIRTSENQLFLVRFVLLSWLAVPEQTSNFAQKPD